MSPTSLLETQLTPPLHSLTPHIWLGCGPSKWGVVRRSAGTQGPDPLGTVASAAAPDSQREIPLQYADGKITINATTSLAPRGYYRLFAINANGAVSTAKWTRLT